MKSADSRAGTKEKIYRYFEAKGGRKTARAVTRIYDKPGDILVNDKSYKEYFKSENNQTVIEEPFKVISMSDRLSASIKVSGGGLNAQAEAGRNALARALIKFNAEFKKRLRRAGYLTRDARMVERKKYGLKKARRAPQWAKR